MPIYLKKVKLMLQYKNPHIWTHTNTTKDHNKKIYRIVKSSSTKQVERKSIYIGNLSKS